jgi:hypothetical protein
LGQHLFIGFHICSGDAIGFGQGGASEAKPNLRKQVQNCAAHGMAGTFFQQHHHKNRRDAVFGLKQKDTFSGALLF